MYKVRITALRRTEYPDLSEKLEYPLEEPCSLSVGQSWISEEGECPEGFCPTAWETLAPFAEKLSRGEGGFYGKWMRNPLSALLSCNDGFRPVSFLLEAIVE
jgi:uncharacterized repeat protein (TIGR04076 family)